MNEIDLIRYALEKQIPKRPVRNPWRKNRWSCPVCYPIRERYMRVVTYQQIYCKDCGQRFDWDGIEHW